MPRLPGLDDLRQQREVISDIANKLDQAVTAMSSYRQRVSDSAADVKDLGVALDSQLKKTQALAAQGIYSQKDIDHVVSLSREMDKLAQKAQKMVGVSENLQKGLDKVGKGLLKMSATSVIGGIDLLFEGIHRVYDLEERWAKVTGEVNQKLGKLSPSMRTFWKESRQAEASIRGLGGELGEGTRMFAEFTAGFNKIDTEGFGKLGIQLAQGFDVGADSAGKFLRTLDNIGFDERQKEASEFMKSIVTGAQTAGVSVNALAKDFAESSNFVARFGKEGAKALTRSAAYLKQFNVSLKDTEKLMDRFDTFDSAAESVAKLNVVFGTSINALNTMLEQDPAKRFEQIRQGLLAQGKTWDKLTYFERKAFTSTTGLAEDQAAAMLDVKNSGKSYTQFLAEQTKRQQQAASAQAMMQQQLRATSKTLYNFGAAADRITVAIANAIKPFTDMLGLTKSGDKEWKSFSEVMESITKTIIRFFNTLAQNRQWKDFMQKAADVTKRLVSYVADFFSPSKIGRNIDAIISALKTFAKVSAGIIALWAGSKVFSGISGGIQLVKDVGTLRGAFGGGAAARSAITSLYPAAVTSSGSPVSGIPSVAKGMGVGGRMGLGGLAGGLAGAGIGSLFGATGAGATGGAIGGGIGAIFGPIGSAIGTALGTAAAIGVSKLLETREGRHVEETVRQLSRAQDDLAASDAKIMLQQSKNRVLQERHDRQDVVLQKVIVQGKKRGISLSEDEQQVLVERVQDMKNLGVSTGLTNDVLRKLSDPSSGPVKLTADQVSALMAASKGYQETVSQLDTESKRYLDNLFDTNQIDLAKKQADAQKDQLDAQLKLAEIQEKNAKDQAHWYDGVLGSTNELVNSVGLANENSKAWEKRLAETRNAVESADARMKNLQAQRNEVETQALQLQVEQNKQARARLEIESLEKYNSIFQSLEKAANGDVATAIEQFSSRGGAISPETLSYVRGQARQARRVGPTGGLTFEPETISRSGIATGGDVVIHNNVNLDGVAIQRHTIKKALTNGR